MSRNEDRLMGNQAAPQSQDSEPIANKELNASDLDFIVASFFVKLPSKGAFYVSTHPLHNQDNVEIKEMTAADEDILSNMSFWENGVGFEKFVDHIVVNKSIKYVDLLYIDSQAIIIQARSASLGKTYSSIVSCPKCKERVPFDIDLEVDLKMEFGSFDKLTEDEKTLVSKSNENYYIRLPRTNLTFESRPMSGRDEKRLFKARQQAEKLKGESDKKALLIDIISTSVISLTLGGKSTDNKEKIKEIIAKVPSSDMAYLREIYGKLFPTLELKGPFVCQKCGFGQEMEAPFDANFFFPSTRV